MQIRFLTQQELDNFLSLVYGILESSKNIYMNLVYSRNTNIGANNASSIIIGNTNLTTVNGLFNANISTSDVEKVLQETIVEDLKLQNQILETQSYIND